MERVKILCNCGNMITVLLTDEHNYKDIANCQCGTKLLIVDISED